MSINVKDLAEAIVEKCGVPRLSAQEGAVELFARIITQMHAGNKVVIPNFGEFSLIVKPARTARNPKTGEAVNVATYKKMEFKPVKAFRKIL